MKKIFLLITFAVSATLLSSCGYTLGANGNPQIKTIAIAPIKNETYEVNISSQMKNALVDRFSFDGTYKIGNMSDADAVLYGKVTNIDITAANILTAPGQVTTVTKTFGATITFEFILIVPGRAQPVVPDTSISGTAQFQVPVDLFPAKSQGFEQACRDAAEQTVWACAEAW